MATVGGDRAGYYELSEDDGGVEVAYFGLLPAFHGQGLGGFLLTHALRRGFELAPRVWLHTCTLDGRRRAAELPRARACARSGRRRSEGRGRGRPRPSWRLPTRPGGAARRVRARHRAGGAEGEGGEQAGLGDGGDLPAVGRAVARDGGVGAAGAARRSRACGRRRGRDRAGQAALGVAGDGRS